MNLRTSTRLSLVAFGLAFAIAGTNALAAGSGQPPTLDQVLASPPESIIEVSCTWSNWPTLRQVARHARTDTDGAAPLRRKILHEGRRHCDSGASHVRAEFRPAVRSVAIVLTDRPAP